MDIKGTENYYYDKIVLGLFTSLTASNKREKYLLAKITISREKYKIYYLKKMKAKPEVKGVNKS